MSETANVWWINQGRSFAAEFGRQIIFAGTDKRQDRHHLVLGDMQIGATTLSYISGYLGAIGVVTASAITTERPYTVPTIPRDSGYLVEVQYFELPRRIPIDELPGNRVGAGPFDKRGIVKFGYAFEVLGEWSDALRAAFQPEWPAGSPWASRE